MAKGFLRPAPKTARPITRRKRTLPHLRLRREARTARRTKTVITMAINKVAIIKIKITTIIAVKAGTAKTPSLALGSIPDYSFTEKIGCKASVPV